MIVFFHNKSKVTEIVSIGKGVFPDEKNRNIVQVLFDFADKFIDEILVWCDESERDNLNINEIKNLFHHKKFLVQYLRCRQNQYF